MRKMVKYIIIAIVVVLVIWLIATYNKLVKLRNRVRNQWSQVDIQLKRRFDLIPNLVETVKGYAAHESDTLEAVMAARAKVSGAVSVAETASANADLTRALSRLLAVSENYPELKANTNFVELQNTLEETEDKISYARQFYNDMVMKYQNKIEMFPTNLIAGLFGFKEESYFAADEAERENVQISFK